MANYSVTPNPAATYPPAAGASADVVAHENDHGPINTLVNLFDTSIASPATGNVPTWNGTGWVPAAPASAVETVNVVAASGSAQTIPNPSTASISRIILTANCTITLPAPGAGKSFTVELVQDATGSRAVTWATPSGSIKWPGGAAPTLTFTANAEDLISFICTTSNWLGFPAGYDIR